LSEGKNIRLRLEIFGGTAWWVDEDDSIYNIRTGKSRNFEQDPIRIYLSTLKRLEK